MDTQTYDGDGAAALILSSACKQATWAEQLGDVPRSVQPGKQFPKQQPVQGVLPKDASGQKLDSTLPEVVSELPREATCEDPGPALLVEASHEKHVEPTPAHDHDHRPDELRIQQALCEHPESVPPMEASCERSEAELPMEPTCDKPEPALLTESSPDPLHSKLVPGHVPQAAGDVANSAASKPASFSVLNFKACGCMCVKVCAHVNL